MQPHVENIYHIQPLVYARISWFVDPYYWFDRASFRGNTIAQRNPNHISVFQHWIQTWDFYFLIGAFFRPKTLDGLGLPHQFNCLKWIS